MQRVSFFLVPNVSEMCLIAMCIQVFSYCIPRSIFMKIKYIPACVDYIVKSILDGYSILGDGQFFGMVKYNEEFYFDRVEDIPEKYRDNVKLRKWFDQIYPTIVYPRQQQAIADLMKRIKLV